MFNSIDSTNKYIKENINKNGTVVIANEQIQGVGRNGRSFLSPAEGVYFSFLVTPNLDFADVQNITICVAVAVTNALKNIFGIDFDIKWVNDIYFNGKKLCGILSEITISKESKKIDKVIIGIGINTGEVPKEISDIATSLCDITDKKISRNKIIAEILNQFENIYINNILKGDIIDIISTYKSRLFIIDKKVTVIGREENFTCVVKDINNNGELIVLKDDGTELSLNSGEISLKI